MMQRWCNSWVKDVELDDVDLPNPYDTEFESVIGPSEMRCLVSDKTADD